MSKSTADAKEDAPCAYPLPLTLSAFSTIVNELRDSIRAEHKKQRDKWIDDTLGTTAEQRGTRTAKQVEADNKTLQEASKSLLDEDPFSSTWVPASSTLPSFPTREVHAAMKSDRSKPEQFVEKANLRDYVSDNKHHLLAMTVEDMRSVSWLDALLFRFALTRKFDVASATSRFLKFRTLVIDNGLIFNIDDDVKAALALGVFQLAPQFSSCMLNPEECNSIQITPEEYHPRTPVLLMRARLMDWTKIKVEAFRKGWFYFVMNAFCSDYIAQTNGVVVVQSMKDFGFANVKMEWQKFVMGAVTQCLPVKIGAGFIANQSWMFGNVMAPVMKSFMSDKVRKKMNVVGTDYAPAIKALGKHRLFEEAGGEATIPTDGSHVLEFIQAMAASPLVKASSSTFSSASSPAANEENPVDESQDQKTAES